MLDTAFTLLGTAVTWLEVIAFVLALANIACNVLRFTSWLTIIASVLYAWLFQASKLYGEAGVSMFFAGAALWGWWVVARPSRWIQCTACHRPAGGRGIAMLAVYWAAAWFAQ